MLGPVPRKLLDEIWFTFDEYYSLKTSGNVVSSMIKKMKTYSSRVKDPIRILEVITYEVHACIVEVVQGKL